MRGKEEKQKESGKVRGSDWVGVWLVWGFMGKGEVGECGDGWMDGWLVGFESNRKDRHF